MSEYMPEHMPDRMPDRMPADMSEYMPEDMADRMPDRMPEDMSDRMPEDLPDRMHQICQIECQKICQVECQKICQIECQKICQIECHKKMPEDMPVRKSINVMVGITRSKVIYLNSTCGKVPGYGWYGTMVREYGWYQTVPLVRIVPLHLSVSHSPKTMYLFMALEFRFFYLSNILKTYTFC